MGARQIKREVNRTCTTHTVHTQTHKPTRISSLVHDWCRQCICDTRPVFFQVCPSPFSNIHITLSAQASVYLYVCVLLNVHGWVGVLFRLTAERCWGEKTACMHEFPLVFTLWHHCHSSHLFASTSPFHTVFEVRTDEQNVSGPQCHLNNTL